MPGAVLISSTSCTAISRPLYFDQEVATANCWAICITSRFSTLMNVPIGQDPKRPQKVFLNTAQPTMLSDAVSGCREQSWGWSCKATTKTWQRQWTSLRQASFSYRQHNQRDLNAEEEESNAHGSVLRPVHPATAERVETSISSFTVNC